MEGEASKARIVEKQ